MRGKSYREIESQIIGMNSVLVQEYVKAFPGVKRDVNAAFPNPGKSTQKKAPDDHEKCHMCGPCYPGMHNECVNGRKQFNLCGFADKLPRI